MNVIFGNLTAILLVAGLAALCVRELVKEHKSGSCGGCAGCGGNCASCSKHRPVHLAEGKAEP